MLRFVAVLHDAKPVGRGLQVKSYYVLPKSCRDAALGVRPTMPRAYVQPRNVMPAPPIRLPNLKTDVTCLALTDTCMGRND